MQVNSRSMRTNNNENNSKATKRDQLPVIKRQLVRPSSLSLTHSILRQNMTADELISPDSTERVSTWLDNHPPPPDRHVQFAQNVTVVDGERRSSNGSIPGDPLRHPNFTISTIDSLPDIDKHHSSTVVAQPHSANDDDVGQYLGATTGSTFYRSVKDKPLSVSSTASSSRRSSNSSTIVSSSRRRSSNSSSMGPAPSLISTNSSTLTKDRPPPLSCLHFHPSLSEADQTKLSDIQHQIPAEFEKLLPTLIKLGVITWPTTSADEQQPISNNELVQRRRVLNLIHSNHEQQDRQRYLEHLYGSILPNDHRQQLLREGLSFSGQYSLLGAYHDEIERELNRKVKHWRHIPLIPARTSLTGESVSQARSSLSSSSSLLANVLRARHKFAHPIRQRTSDASSNIYPKSAMKKHSITSLTSTMTLNSFSDMTPSPLPQNIDEHWQEKCVVNLIEQGMTLLDRARQLPMPPTISDSNNDQDEDILKFQDRGNEANRRDIVRSFKRWILLWSTLYNEDKANF